jgi:hypothetical protein
MKFLRYVLLFIAGALCAVAIPALADLNYTQGSGTVIFDFVCFATKHCPSHVNVNSSGTEIGTNANPIRIDPTGTTTQTVSGNVSVTGSVSNASSGVATTGTNLPSAAYNYGFNGTTWDQIQVDASKFLKINCAAGCSSAGDLTQSFSITSSTTSTVLALVGSSGVQFNLTGSFVATVVGQISNDNVNWQTVPLLNMSVTPPAYIAANSSANAVGNYLLVGTQGSRYARISVTYTSGTVAGTMTATSQGQSVTFGDYINYLNIISALPAGSAIIGKFGIDQTTPGTTNGVVLNTGSNFVGSVSVTPSTGGGWSKWSTAKNNSNTALTNTVVSVKSSAAALFGGYFISNPNASVACVQIFDVATAGGVTLGTTRPDLERCIPANTAANIEMANGVNMANGIQIAATTTASGSTAPGTGLDLDILFK